MGGGRLVQSVTVDGAPRTKTWLSFAPRSRPRDIVVATTDEDSAWGRRSGDVPPSYPSG
jgi:hypothetical protein